MAKYINSRSMRSIRIIWMSAVCVSAVHASLASAETTEDAKGPQTVNRETSESFEDIVVTARKRDERLIDVPAAVSAVSSESLVRANVTSLGGLSVLVPALALDKTYGGSAGVLAIRGVGSSFQDSALEQSVLLDLDGIPISRGRIINEAFFDVQGVEILKGPQALFFGKNSPGGVVSVRSKNPTSSLEGYGRVSYEFTADEPSFQGAISGPLTAGISARLAMFAARSRGYVYNTNPGVFDPLVPGVFLPTVGKRLGEETRMGGRLTVDLDPSGPFNARFKLLATKFRGENQLLAEVMSCPGGNTRPVTFGVADPNGDCRLNWRNSTGNFAPAYFNGWDVVGDGTPRTRSHTILPSLTMNYELDDITFTSVTGFYHYKFIGGGPVDATAFASTYVQSKEENTTFSQEIRAVTSFDSIFNFSVGGFYETSDRDLLQAATASPTRLPPDPASGRRSGSDLQYRNKSDAYSVFGQVNIEPFEGLELAGGARYSHEEKRTTAVNEYVHPALVAGLRPVGSVLRAKYSRNNVSPEVTLTWRPNSGLTVYGAYKTGFLSGAISNPGALTAAATATTLTVDPTKAEGGEIGIKTSQLGGRLNADIVAYRYKYKGLQLTAFDVATATFRTLNAASTLIKGIELQGSFRATEELSLRGSVAYNDAKYLDFTGATCYPRQTVALGCTAGRQDLSGKPLFNAPKYTWNAGATYKANLSSDLIGSLSVDVRQKSKYFVSLSQNPGSLQKRYTLLDASLQLATADGEWEVSLIGRNLTKVAYGTIGADKPSGIGEIITVSGAPRTVALQITKNF